MLFRVPVYVTQTPTGFAARPLFHAGPARADDNLNRLLTRLSRDVAKVVEELARSARQDAAAAWAFAPPVTAHRHTIAVDLRRQTVKAKYLFAAFPYLGRRVAFTPSVPDVWFEVPRAAALEDRAAAALTEYWRKVERDADDPDAVDPAADSPAGKAWVQTLPVAARVPTSAPPPPASLFELLGGGSTPDGAGELRRVGRCLDWLYPDELDRADRREPETAELLRLLAAPDRRPVLVVGPRLAGKTAVVHEVAFRRAAARGGPGAKEQIWLVSPQRLISGMSYVGQWEGRLLAILRHARKRDHVLYFDDLVGLFLAGMTSQSSLSAGMVLKPYLEDRTIRVLGEATPEALRVLRERDRGFADLFQILPVREPTAAATRDILVGLQRRLEAKHDVNFGLDALPAVTDVQGRYDRASAFPGKAAAVLARLAAKAAAATPDIDPDAADPFAARPRVGRDEVLADFAARSGLSLDFLDPNRRLDPDDVRAKLAAQVIGQPAATDALADVIAVAKARLNDPGRPLAAFLFLGPTGVGKTEAAKAAARVLFGDAGELLRFDLNEFNQPGSAARLVGTFGNPEGLLTAAVRRRPFAVILFDEIEKADPDVADVLLQVLGEGRLTDGLGRTADFTQTIIILTSNLGVRDAEGRAGFGGEAGDPAAYVRAAEAFFRPEFFNRLDRVVPFSRLTRDDVSRIADRLVGEVLSRDGFAQRQCVLDVTPAAVARIVDAGFDPRLGARAMKRAVERELTRPAAARLAAMPPGDLTIVTVDAAADSLSVDVASPGWATVILPRDAIDAADRAAAARVQLAAVAKIITALRPAGPVRGGAVTPDQERYFALKEIADCVAERLAAVADRAAARRPHADPTAAPMTRRARYRVIKGDRHTRYGDLSSFRLMIGAIDVDEAVRDLAADTEPADDDQDLLEIEHQLALLAVTAAAPPDARRTVLWVCGFRGRPAWEERVARLYETAWGPDLGVEVAVVPTPPGVPPGNVFLDVKGVPARRLAETEVGTHLVLPPVGGPVPVRVAVLDGVPATLPAFPAFGPVLRVYHPAAVFDVRTRLTAAAPYDPAAVRAFTLGVLPRPWPPPAAGVG